MGAIESVEQPVETEEVTGETYETYESAWTAERLVLLGKIEATLLLLQLALVKINKDKAVGRGFVSSEPPKKSDLPELCRLTQVCRNEQEQALLFANEAAVWLFYNQLPTIDLQRQAMELVEKMITTLEAWRQDPRRDFDETEINEWEAGLNALRNASQDVEQKQATAASRVPPVSQRPMGSIRTVEKPAGKTVRFAV